MLNEISAKLVIFTTDVSKNSKNSMPHNYTQLLGQHEIQTQTPICCIQNNAKTVIWATSIHM
jgi:hypothetical protein